MVILPFLYNIFKFSVRQRLVDRCRADKPMILM